MSRTLLRSAPAALALAALLAAPARSAELKVGDTAPPFTLKGSDGKTYSLADFRGKQAVVVAWYPKAFTGGCTRECKSFAQNSAELKKTGVAYFAASVDEADYNKKFAESLSADYPILSDPDKSVATAYGVLNPGSKLALRWTFYIDKDGKIAAIDKMVKPDSAAADLIAKSKSLGLAK